MAQRPEARRVLLVSGGVSGTAREVLKYGVEAVDYVELDPRDPRGGRRFLPESLARSADPRHQRPTAGYVKQTAERYDVVILDVPDPSTSQINRFYTREFFAEVRRCWRPAACCRSRWDSTRAISARRWPGCWPWPIARCKEVYANVLIIPAARSSSWPPTAS